MTNTTRTIDEAWGRQFFTMVDRIDAQEYVSYFAPDGQVVFGNDQPITGHEAILSAMKQFYGSLESMHHAIANLWVENGDTLISQAVATYQPKQGKQVSLPVVTIINLAGEKVRKVQFYMDLSPLKAA